MNKFVVPKFEPDDNKGYKMEPIQDNAFYAKEANRHLLGLYYLGI